MGGALSLAKDGVSESKGELEEKEVERGTDI